jgi:hypothetical protein
MPFVTECLYCRHQIQAPDGSAGLSATCPKCHNCFTVVPAAKAPAATLPKARTHRVKKAAPFIPVAAPVAPPPDRDITPAPTFPSEAFAAGETRAEVPRAPAPISFPAARSAPVAGRWKIDTLGAVALLLGGLALAVASFPYVGLLTIPLSLLGLIVGVAGWLRAAGTDPVRCAWPIAGAVVSLLVLAVTLLLPGLLRRDSSGPSEPAPDALRTLAIPLDGNLKKRTLTISGGPRTGSDGGEWVDASQALASRSGVRLHIQSVAVTAVAFREGGKKKITPKKYLVVRLQVKNVGAGDIVSYQGWGTAGGSGQETAVLMDSAGKSYGRKLFGPGVEVEKQVGRFSLFPGRTVEDTLVFEPPANISDFLYLELPATACAGTGTYRFAIPRSMMLR